MARTIQEFIEFLKTEGIEAAQAEADRIISNARKEAEKILEDAQKESERIIEDAKKEAEALREKVNTELRLASRDSIVKLRSALLDALRSILEYRVEGILSDEEFIKGVLKEIIMQFVRADCQNQKSIVINVSDKAREGLTHWALELLRESPELHGRVIDIKSKLREAGFEYTIEGSTVEITTKAVADIIMDLVGPQVKDLIKQQIEKLQHES